MTVNPQFPKLLPDYSGGSILNLVASVTAARGAAPSSPSTPLLSHLEMQRFRTIVLLVIDGLGFDYLTGRWPDSFLHRHLVGRLTSVFPTTTAAAITTFLTGLPPAQHGLTGWHMWLESLASIVTVLPFQERGTHLSLTRRGVTAADLLQPQPLFTRLDVDCHVVSPARIAWSAFNQAFTQGAATHAFEDLDGMCGVIARLCGNATRERYIYAYWPELDHLAHQHGISGTEVDRHFASLDAAINTLQQAIAGPDTLLLVCADHGFIDSSPRSWVQAADRPALQAMLRMPLCGEPRAAYCYLKSGMHDAFESYVQTELETQCQAFRSTELIDQGLFGSGEVHPALHSRVGDYTLIMQGNFCIADPPAGESPPQLVGVHGGLSAGELYVPLIAIPG